MSSPVAHHSLGGSSAERWLKCPASAALCAKLPEPPDSPYSKEGTRAHALGEYCLREGMEPHDLIGVSIPDFKDDTRIDKDMADAVKVYVDDVRARAEQPGAELFLEVKFAMPFLPPDATGKTPFGTNDACVLYPDGTLHVLDYKHGAGRFVSEEDNAQLQYYALGAINHFEAQGRVIKRVRAYIVQPRCSVGKPVRGVERSRLQLLDFKLYLIAGARRTGDADAPFVVGPHCKKTFCKGAYQGACEAYRNAALGDMAPTGSPFEPLELPDPAATDDADILAAQLDRLPLLKDYISCLESHALDLAKAGKPPTGYKLGAADGRRVWAEDEETVQAELSRVTNKDVAPRKLVTVAEAEKLIGKQKFAELARLVTRKAGAPRLVKDDKPDAAKSTPYSRMELF